MTPAERRTQKMYLARLARLIRNRWAYREDFNPAGIRLLEQAIQATINDCDDFGCGDEARLMVTGGVV